MKLILFFLLSITSLASMANSITFYTIKTEERYTDEELKAECKQHKESAALKLVDIASRLSAESPQALSVTSSYGVDTYTTWSGRIPRTNYIYYCALKFRSDNPSLSFEKYTVSRITHIGRNNWETACEPAYQAAMSNENSPVSVHWLFWTLIQGRSCDVTTVEVKKI